MSKNPTKEVIMRKSLRSTVLILAMVVLLAACAGRTFVQNTYATMYIAGTSYDTAMKTISALQSQGKITQTQRDEINKYANGYYVAYYTAIDAFEVYMSTKSATDETKLNTALLGITAAWANFAGNVNRLIPGALASTLPKQ